MTVHSLFSELLLGREKKKKTKHKPEVKSKVGVIILTIHSFIFKSVKVFPAKGRQ